MKIILSITVIFLFSGCHLLPGETYEQELDRIVHGLNADLPKMLDSETRIDSIRYQEPNTLVYVYTLVNIPSGEADTTAFYRAMWPGILSHVRISPDLKKLREKNTIVRYHYNDNEGRNIYRFVVKPEDYN